MEMGEGKTVELVGSEENRLVATRFDPDQPSKLAPVLLMHGGGQTRHSWKGAAELIAGRGHIAFTVDARGHGDSQWVESKHYTAEHFRNDLRAITRQVGDICERKPIIIGASLGGISAMLAQALGGFDGDRALFAAIVLVDVTPRMSTDGVDRIMGFMAQNMLEGFSSVEDAAEVIAAYLPNRKRPKSLDGLSKNLRQRDDGRWYWHWDPAFLGGDHNILTGRENRMDALFDAVKKITVPTLLVRGGKSELVTKEAVEEFLEIVPHAKYTDVSGAGHMVAGDRNDVFADAVLEFLQSEVLN